MKAEFRRIRQTKRVTYCRYEIEDSGALTMERDRALKKKNNEERRKKEQEEENINRNKENGQNQKVETMEVES